MLFCPVAVTGGIEAIHQLSDSLLRQGFKASIAFYGGECSQVVENNVLICGGQLSEELVAAYQGYQSIRAREIPLDSEVFFVFPETNAENAFNCHGVPRAIWWLSVDNFTLTHPHLLNRSTLRDLFEDESVLHFYQSRYAQDFLHGHGARSVFPLFDYVSAAYLDSLNDTSGLKTVDFAFFPRKGADVAQEFLNHGGNSLGRVAIQGMTQDQVLRTLASSRIYIDFGHHPGKDRVPREAACMGNIVFLHEKGAAAFFEDHPLHSDYIFTTQDVRNGSLLSRVREVLQQPEDHLKRQEYYRRRISMEKEEFDWQVKCAFGGINLSG